MIYDKYNEKYKFPLGAIKTNENIRIRIVLPACYDNSKVAIVLFHNISRIYRIIEFYKIEMLGDERVWECNFCASDAGVYWYNFKISVNKDRKEYVIPGKGKRPYITCFLNQMFPMKEKYWRVTVYEENFSTPDWIKGEIYYQIFPDRFNKGGQNEKKIQMFENKEICDNRRLHSNWNVFPCWYSLLEFMGSHMDFYGGNIKGITEKMDYISKLGIKCIYLNPIFESNSSHRYNTADYEKVDDMLGTDEDFIKMCKTAESKGIKVINDGVFSHSGSDSKYFNVNSHYDSIGAYNSQTKSEYYSWYTFYSWPDYYLNWWNFDSLPKLNLHNKECYKYFLGDNGIIEKWYAYGNTGWRIDAIDDLPDEFIDGLREKVKKLDVDNLIIGEVWHDASLEKYVGHDVYPSKLLLGKQLDTVTNYVFRDAIIAYIKQKNATVAMDIITEILDDYPKPAIDVLMNVLSTHDTPRILTLLGKNEDVEANRGFIDTDYAMTADELKKGITLLKIATLIQFTLPGVPCIYYGDEIGMEGYNDPYNRAPFAWEYINSEVYEWYKELCHFRKKCVVLKEGKLKPIIAKNGILGYTRKNGKMELFCIFNVNDEEIVIEDTIYKKYMGTEESNGKIYIKSNGYALYTKKNSTTSMSRSIYDDLCEVVSNRDRI